MRRSMGSTLWRFSTTRMLHDYVERMYLSEAHLAAGAEAVTAGAKASAEPVTASDTDRRISDRRQG